MGKFETLENILSPCVHKAIEDQVFSGCCLAIGQGKKSLIKNFGVKRWGDVEPITDKTFFDLASLTKPLATSLVVFSLIAQKKMGLEDQLGQLLDRQIPADKEAITLFQLLNHCSGLAGHRHFYKILEHLPEPERQAELLRLILSDELEAPPGQKDIYSDLGFILLGLIVERKSGMPLEEAVTRYVYQPLALEGKLLFNPRHKGIVNFAATEECPWRGRLLIGEVDDQNTWVLGGVSGQAGLFGRGRDVLEMVVNLSKIASGAKKHPFLGKDLLSRAMRRQGEIKASSWGLGFDTPSETGSSAGRFISKKSCGHLGFTGTSFWHDFERHISVVLLTNRIHPSVDNDKIKSFRPLLHDLIFETLA